MRVTRKRATSLIPAQRVSSEDLHQVHFELPSMS